MYRQHSAHSTQGGPPPGPIPQPNQAHQQQQQYAPQQHHSSHHPQSQQSQQAPQPSPQQTLQIAHAHPGAATSHRLPELLEAIKHEFLTLADEIHVSKMQRDELADKLSLQIQELAQVQQSVQELDRMYRDAKAGYEEEIARLRREIDNMQRGGGSSAAASAGGSGTAGGPSSSSFAGPPLGPSLSSGGIGSGSLNGPAPGKDGGGVPGQGNMGSQPPQLAGWARGVYESTFR
ncbi:general transcription repressor [Gonapodya sp. JEL0774]|nr:general transcription repressor [Gonapodya sp. JEL0774]